MWSWIRSKKGGYLLLNVLALCSLTEFPAEGYAHSGLSPQVLALARACAPDVHPLTVAYLVSAESRSNPIAINVNGKYRMPHQPTTERDARDTIRWLDQHGLNYDVGYAQINSANFRSLGLTGTQLLDPCTNLHASAQVLGDCYERAVREVGEGQTALRRALSCYNTGSQKKGFSNGYVARVVAQAKLKIPALLDGPTRVNASGFEAANLQAVPALTAQVTLQHRQNRSASDQPVQSGEASAAVRIEAGAFAHPEFGAFRVGNRDFNP